MVPFRLGHVATPHETKFRDRATAAATATECTEQTSAKGEEKVANTRHVVDNELSMLGHA